MATASDPLILYLDQTDEGLPGIYGDGTYGEMDYGGHNIDADDLVERTVRVTIGFGSSGFGTRFGTRRSELVDVSRVIRPQDRQGLDYRRVKNDAGDWQVEIPGGFDLHDWLEAGAYILDSTGPRFVGRVWDFSHAEDSTVARLSGPGLGGDLDRASTDTTFRSERAWDAFRDYIEEFADGWSVAIEEPDVSTVAVRDRIQHVRGVREDLEEATSIDQTDPFLIRQGAIEPAQTCFTTDATETTMREIVRSDAEDAGEVGPFENYSGGFAIRFRDQGDRVEYTFDADYTIPQARIGIRGGGIDGPELTVGIDEIDRDAIELYRQGNTRGLHWADLRQFGEELRNVSGRTTVVIEATSDPATSVGFSDIDVIAPYDLRWPPSFPNTGPTIGGVRYLNGPELYPQSLNLRADRVETQHNVTRGEIFSDWSDTSREQALALSNNFGQNWGSFGNLESLGVIFDGITYGYGLEPRFTFSWGDSDGLRNATPRRGYETQRLEGWRLYATTNDLRVIDEKELSDTHLKNIQDLAERAGVRFYIDTIEQHIEAFHRRQRQDELLLYDPELDVDRDDLTLVYNEGVYNAGFYGGGLEPPHPGFRFEDVESSKTTGTDYANVVIVRGQGGIEAEARDEREIEAISRYGRDSEAVFVHSDAEIETETDAAALAEELLAEMKLNRDFDGTVTGLPRQLLDDQSAGIHPGIEYFVDNWGLYSELEEVAVDDEGVDLDFEGATADQIIQGIKLARRRADSAHRAL